MRWLMLLLLCACTVSAFAADPALYVGATPTEATALKVAEGDHTAYTLPAGKLVKAQALERTFTMLGFVHEAWNIAELVLLLWLGIAAWMARCAVGAKGRNPWVEGAIFCLLLLMLHILLGLPLRIYAHHVVLRDGLSIQGWASWSFDLLKSLAIFYVLGVLGVMLFFFTMRLSPRRWWLWFAGAVSICIVAGAFATPYLYDPLFNTFTPMQQVDPELVTELERVVAKGKGIAIPPERMFVMKASDKVTTTNAYVTGFGGSKRVVVWDTSLAKGSRNDVLAMFSHEMGHYVLGHVALGIGLTMLSLVFEFWLGFHAARWLLGRYGERWGIRGQGRWAEWGTLVVYLLILGVFSFVTEPVANGVSRWMEHNADVYGQEALHGVVGDPAEVTELSFQHLGEESLDDPAPNEFVVLWTYTHPSIALRAAFARVYDPWVKDAKPKYFAR